MGKFGTANYTRSVRDELREKREQLRRLREEMRELRAKAKAEANGTGMERRRLRWRIEFILKEAPGLLSDDALKSTPILPALQAYVAEREAAWKAARETKSKAKK